MIKILSIILYITALVFSRLTPAKDNVVIFDSRPIKIYADNQGVDLTDDTVTFTGHVTVIQDNIQLTADKVVINHINNKKNKQIVASGSPVKFYQRSPSNKNVDGHADKLIYNVEESSAILTGKAHLSHGDNTINNHTIYYNINSQLISANSDLKHPVKITIIPNQFK